LVDVNRDGKLDILIGNQIGKIAYYQNIGTAQSPSFNLVTQTFGKVYTGLDNGVNIIDGYCIPQLFDVNGSYRLLCGSKSGRVFRYDGIDGNLNGSFAKTDTNYLHIWEGYNSSVAIADINNDGQVDMMVGNVCGGLNYYSGDITASINDAILSETEVKIFPNPSNNWVTIQTTATINRVEVFTIFGQQVFSTNQHYTNSANIHTQDLDAGVYFCKLYLSDGVVVKKLVVKH
jgi:hypothetical protein